jgi:carbonic anhydrase
MAPCSAIRVPPRFRCRRSRSSKERGNTRCSVTDSLIVNNEAYVATFENGELPLPPAGKLAVLACMDARLDPAKILGLQEGDAHVIRNAGGVASDDALRSLAISQNLLGTEEIILIHHTDCGMLKFTDDELAEKLEAETGSRPEWRGHAFPDLEQDLRDSIQRIKDDPFVPHTTSVRGFVYEVETGRLREVS